MDDAKKYLDAIAKRLSQLWEQHRRAIPQGLFTGSVCALAYLVIKPFYSLAVAWGTSKVPKQIAEGYRQPDQLFALALFIACTLLLASSGWLANFLRRSVNSLKFGIIVGWFPASAAGAFICWVVAPRVTSIVFAAAILMGLFSGQLLFAVLLIPKAPADVSIPDIPIDSFTKIDFDSPIREKAILLGVLSLSAQ